MKTLSSEPVLVISGAISVLLNALNAFVLTFVHLSPDQTAAEAGLLAALTALVLAWISRGKVSPV